MVIIPDKESFYESISSNTEFDSDFFKKIYGYSYCDKGFTGRVAKKLLTIQRRDAIEEYNKWLIEWLKDENAIMKRVASWYCNELQKTYGYLFNEMPERKVNTSCTTEELLLQKKKLLLQKKKLLMKK